jgi:hypothetical protein
MELFLHHRFISTGWPVSVEPEVPGSSNKPDFHVSAPGASFYLEAKLILDARNVTQQNQRLNQLAETLHKKLSRTVMLEPLSDLPHSLPAAPVVKAIEDRAAAFPADKIAEFDLACVHQGVPFTFKVAVFPQTWDLDGGIGALSTGARTLTLGADIREALRVKAGKYGDLYAPYVICLWSAEEFPSNSEDEYDALFGTRVWRFPSGAGPVIEDRKRDGFFCRKKPGEPPHPNVSAVLFYDFKWREEGHRHALHVYHNPFAKYPLAREIFDGIPQMILEEDGKMRWIGGTPDGS